MLAGALELFIVSLGLTYYVATVGAGLRVIRRSRKARRARAARAARGLESAGIQRDGARDGGVRADDALGEVVPGDGVPGDGVPGDGGRGSGPGAELAATVSSGWGRLRTRLETAEEPADRAGLVVPPEDCVVYYLIPCLNEELVIGDTVRSLLTDSRGLVVVVDDASDDRTGELAAAAGGDRVIVVRRELPEARRGKGPALNAGFTHVLHDAGVRGISASRITVCVMDADGRLSDGALDVVLPLFEDPRVGGVQLPVRIRNRNSLLTVMQDLEFWGVCAVAQLGRMACGTVSLGGNGQFTRLAALLEMGAAPWQAQLTEDLDLSLALAAKGWRLTSAPDAHVSQQGVTSLRALVNQRTRWYQGHMQAVRWLRELWSSRQLSHLAMLELTIYLLVPWALVLPWSIIFNYNLLIMVLWVFGWVSTPGLGNDLTQKIATLAFWYTLSCLPIYMAGFLYGRQERKVGYIRAFFIGHLLLVGNYVTYAACWRAVYRLITGAHGWEKTRRTDERQRTASAPALSPTAASTFTASLAAAARATTELDRSTLDVAALDATAWAAAAQPATWRPSARATRSEGAGEWRGPIRSGSAVARESVARVPWPRRAAPAESHADPGPDRADHDATTTDLPVVAEPVPAARHARTDRSRAGKQRRGETTAGLAWAGDGLAASAAPGPARADHAAAGDGLDRDLPVRRPGSRSGHGQSRRVAGSHRAARAQPAQRSGR